MRVYVKIGGEVKLGVYLGLMAPQGCDRCGDDGVRAVVRLDKPQFGLFLDTFPLSWVTPLKRGVKYPPDGYTDPDKE